MAINRIGQGSPPSSYQKFSINFIENWDTFKRIVEQGRARFSDAELTQADAAFRDYVNEELRRIGRGNSPNRYGMFGKQPSTYDETIQREKYVYWAEYIDIKKRLEKIIRERLAASSVAEVMKPKMVFNDKQIGEFVFDRAAMSLQPQLYFYSPSKKREIDLFEEKTYVKIDKTTNQEKMYLESDDSLVVRAFKVTLDDGSIEYVIVDGEESLREAVDKGKISVISTNKKVFLYKEKIPRQYNAVKIVVGLRRGGFSMWLNDFYTGIAAVLMAEILETLGYSIEIIAALGGGRCAGCHKKLRFNGRLIHGRRFFLVKLKDFDAAAEIENLLYMLSDPSFHQVKFVGQLNTLFKMFGDELSLRGDPASTWHGISPDDMVNPIGARIKSMDWEAGNRNLQHFYIHMVGSEIDIIRQVTEAVISCENKNLQAALKAQQYESRRPS